MSEAALSKTDASASTRPVRPRRWLRFVVVSAAVLGTWLYLTGGDGAAWAIGVPAALLASRAALRSSGDNPPVPPVEALRLAMLLVGETARATWSVMGRVVARRPRVAPRFVPFEARLENADARVVFAYCLSLLPGTVAARIDGGDFVIHVLDTEDDWHGDLVRLENQIGRTFESDRSWPA